MGDIHDGVCDPVCVVAEYEDNSYHEANARLIAAAPSLEAALRRLRDACLSDRGAGNLFHVDDDDINEASRALALVDGAV